MFRVTNIRIPSNWWPNFSTAHRIARAVWASTGVAWWPPDGRSASNMTRRRRPPMRNAVHNDVGALNYEVFVGQPSHYVKSEKSLEIISPPLKSYVVLLWIAMCSYDCSDIMWELEENLETTGHTTWNQRKPWNHITTPETRCCFVMNCEVLVEQIWHHVRIRGEPWNHKSPLKSCAVLKPLKSGVVLL